MRAALRATEQPAVRPPVAGLYAVTPDLADTDALVAAVTAALEGGATAVQYRNKAADAALRSVQAIRLAELCALHGVPLIVNDHADLALALRGAGLHVGADDCDDLRALRERLGPARILGVSCYRSVDAARVAAAAGADYVAFGSVFPSTVKPEAVPAELGLFAAARGLGVSLVGIGGITRANVATLVDAGADAAAVITDLFAPPAADIRGRARTFAAAFDRL